MDSLLDKDKNSVIMELACSLAEKDLVDKVGVLPEDLTDENGEYFEEYQDEFDKNYDFYMNLFLKLENIQEDSYSSTQQMNVRCTRCGGTNVFCEAIINPNTNKRRNFTDESFSYGICENCDNSAILTDCKEIEENLQSKYEEYYRLNLKEPNCVSCQIVWKDTQRTENVIIKLTIDTGEEDNVFFYCNHGIDELKELVRNGAEEFYIIWIYNFMEL